MGVEIESQHGNVPYLVDDQGETTMHYPLIEAKREGFIGAERILTQLFAIPESGDLRVGLRLTDRDQSIGVPLWAKGFDGVDELRPNLLAAVGYDALMGCVQIDPADGRLSATLLGVASNGEETPLIVEKRTVGAYVGTIT